MDHRGTVGRIYKDEHYILLQTKFESSGPCGFGEVDFFMFYPLRPRGVARMDPRGTVGRIYKEDHYTLLLTKYESSGPFGFGEDFFMFSHWGLWELIFDPGPWLAGFIKRTTIHCYTQNMKALGLVVSEKKISFYIFPMTPRGGARMDPRGTVGRIYEEDH